MIQKEKIGGFLDEGFPQRVLRTSVFLSLIITGCSLSYMSLKLTLSLAIGCFLSLSMAHTLWWTIRHALRNKQCGIKRVFLKVGIVKYFVTGLILFVICAFLDINAIALAIGLSIVMAVIMMKCCGVILVNYMNKSSGTPSRDINHLLYTRKRFGKGGVR